MKKELTVKELARMGGRARFAKMTNEEKSALARKGSDARWGKNKKNVEVKNRSSIGNP